MTILPCVPHLAARRRIPRSELSEQGIVAASEWGRDELALRIPDRRRGREGEWLEVVAPGLTVGTHTRRRAAPVVEPGWWPDAYCPGLHRGRPALVQQGRRALPYRRAGYLHEEDYAGLNLHSWEGRSDGCLTAPGWWIDAVLAALYHLAQSGSWAPARHPDGRWCVGLLLEEAA